MMCKARNMKETNVDKPVSDFC